MENKNTLILAATGVIVLVVVVALVLSLGKSGIGAPQNAQNAPAAGAPVPEPVSKTKQPVPANVVVPGLTSTNLPQNVAKPKIVTPAAPGISANFRTFAIGVSNNMFTPDTVIVNVGDTVHLSLTSADKNYDFTQPDYGFNAPLPKGVAKVIEFQATTVGKFTFYCKICGGPDKGPVGYVVVAPK